MKNRNEQSLRWQVEKWLAPVPVAPVHVTRFGHTGWRGRCVRVETSSSVGAYALFFFRRGDGSWSVLPSTADMRKLTTEHSLVPVTAVTC
ncbi:hypothetical protein GCT13_01030 [Paraburkholderia sp. CNPSo 3157]|uniref:Uncharacterized protein n=1 Tax=Paraburkholderia franconis TaxID=2654983 RepID=A0A7X1N540_9BURK|nr:hypothetical protein [Paraburkholderia franconis]